MGMECMDGHTDRWMDGPVIALHCYSSNCSLIIVFINTQNIADAKIPFSKQIVWHKSIKLSQKTVEMNC